MKFPITALVLTGSLAGGVMLARAATPADSNARCYHFSVPSPAREPNAPDRSELWCYRQIQGPAGGTYVFNGDRAKVRPELAILKTNKGTLNQGSLDAGVVHVHSVPFKQYNPLSVPLTEPTDRRAESAPATADFSTSADEVLQLLQSAKPDPTAQSPVAVVGQYSANASYLPWRGYWWPYKGLPIVGPLSKADRGAGTSAAAWESSHHVSHGIWWEGHCNGWAAASILRAEPRGVRVDDNSGASFGISDRKGLASEADYCAPASFFGWRHPGNSGVSPADFHKTLVHYIGGLHRLIAFNIDNNGVIDNRVISGYDMDVQPWASGYVVTTKIRYHEYDGRLTENTGPAHMVTKVYRYTLNGDGMGGLAAGGQWLSASPGFVWVPLSTGGKCSEGNPRISDAYVDSIVN